METLPYEVRYVSPYDLEAFKRGRKVGYYLLGRVIGEGSFAKVREGVHILTGEKVAVKIIDKKLAREDRYISKNLRREAKILQLIRHAHIIQLLEVLETDNFYYLVMEFCAGGELLDYICARKRLDEVVAKKLIGQLVSAVDAMHRAGIVHRDLKIENFLMTEGDDLKIIDFGLSNTVPSSCVETLEKTGVFPQLLNTHCGSPAYAAPELLAQKNYGPQVDVWSIGINMYAMLTGFLPYMMEPFNVMEVYEKMMQRKMTPIPSFLSKQCRDLLIRLLEPVPEWRISLHHVMKHAWFEKRTWVPRDLSLGDLMYNKKELCESVLVYMKNSLKIKTKDTVNAVIANRALHASAVYHLLVKRLDRYLREGGKLQYNANTNNFSNLQIVKKATLPSPEKMTHKLESWENGKTKRFTFRGRKISPGVTKSQPSLTSDSERKKSSKPNIIENSSVENHSCSGPTAVSEKPPSVKEKKTVKKEKLSRTCSDNTHRREQRTQNLPPSNLSKPTALDTTPETVVRRHKRNKSSASSMYEDDIRNSIRNSLTCDSDQDFLKPVDNPVTPSGTRSRSPHEPCSQEEEEAMHTSRKISVDSSMMDNLERKGCEEYGEGKSMVKTELDKLVDSPAMGRHRTSVVVTDENEDKLKEKKEAYPGWLITKIVKQPPLKSPGDGVKQSPLKSPGDGVKQPPLKSPGDGVKQPPLKSPGDGVKSFLRKHRESESNETHPDQNNNSEIVHREENPTLPEKDDTSLKNTAENNDIVSKIAPEKDDIISKVAIEKDEILSKRTIENQDISSKITTKNNDISSKITTKNNDISSKITTGKVVPENNPNMEKKEKVASTKEISNRKTQNSSSESVDTSARKESVTNNEFPPLRRAITAKSLTVTDPDPPPTFPRPHRTMSTDNINTDNLPTNLPTKTRTYGNLSVSPKNVRSVDDLRACASGAEITCSSDDTSAKLENNIRKLESNIEYIERHHLNNNSNYNNNNNDNNRIDKNENLSVNGARKRSCSVDCTATIKEKESERDSNSRLTPEQYANTVRKLSNSYRHEGVWKPPERIESANRKFRKSSGQETIPACVRMRPSISVEESEEGCNIGCKNTPIHNFTRVHQLRPASTPPGSVFQGVQHIPIKASKSCDTDTGDVISPRCVVRRQRISKLESFKNNFSSSSSCSAEYKINSSINKISPSKKVVELNTALFKNISSSRFDQGRRASTETLNTTDTDTNGVKRFSLSLKPLEISFDFVEMKKRALALKNQAKSMPNVNDLDDVGVDDTPMTHASHGYSSPTGVDMGTMKTGYPIPGDMSHIHGEGRYYSSLSLPTSESLV